MIEKRQFTRINFDASARLRHQDNHWPTHLLDISLKGALIELPGESQLEINDPISLYLLLSDKETEIVMEGHVSHLENGHMGMVCDHLDVDSASHLRRIVELNTGSEAMLNRELEALLNYHEAS